MITNFLVRTFIRDYQKTTNREVRQRYGSFAGTVGIICNILLFLIKLIAGLLTSSISVISDAFNNLSDAGSSVITLFGFRLASQPADKGHPYGHGRIEYITGVIISMMIMLVGVLLFKSSVEKIISGEMATFSWLAFSILVISLLVKMWMWHFYMNLGDRIGSVALQAAGLDSRSDCITTSAVILGMLLEHLIHVPLDGWFGLIVSIFIMYSGLSAARDSLSPLIGDAPDQKMVTYIESLTRDSACAHGYHNLLAHNYGPGNWMITFDVVLDENLTLKQAHSIISEMEEEIEDQFGCLCTIHPDPYDDESEDRR